MATLRRYSSFTSGDPSSKPAPPLQLPLPPRLSKYVAPLAAKLDPSLNPRPQLLP